MSSTEAVSLRGRWALVTGASSGIGVDFARELAARGMNIIVVARRKDRLDTLAEELRKIHGVQVDVVAQDLGVSDAGRLLHHRVQELGREVEILINNAGFGLQGEFREVDWERHVLMLRVDIETLTQLTWLYTREMVARGHGRVLQVASVGAFQPTPGYAAYGAAKAYVLHFGEALHYELRHTGVTITTLCPGATDTEFTQVAGAGNFKGLFALLLQTPARVAAIGVRAMLRGRTSVVPGWINAFNAWFMHQCPFWLSKRIAAMSLG